MDDLAHTGHMSIDLASRALSAIPALASDWVEQDVLPDADRTDPAVAAQIEDEKLVRGHQLFVMYGQSVGWPTDLLRAYHAASHGLPCPQEVHTAALKLHLDGYGSWVPGDPYTKQRCVLCPAVAHRSYVGRTPYEHVRDSDLARRRVPLCDGCKASIPDLARWCWERTEGALDVTLRTACGIRPDGSLLPPRPAEPLPDWEGLWALVPEERRRLVGQRRDVLLTRLDALMGDLCDCWVPLKSLSQD